jgi:hypothetical protein
MPVERRSPYSFLATIAFFMALPAPSGACECDCVASTPDNRVVDSQGFPSGNPILQKNQCTNYCENVSVTALTPTTPLGTCMSGSVHPLPSPVIDWCSSEQPPPGIPIKAPAGVQPGAGIERQTGTAFGDQEPMLCPKTFVYDPHKYRVWCWVAAKGVDAQRCVATGTSSCGSIGNFGRDVIQQNRCMKIWTEVKQERWFELYAVRLAD